MVTRLGDCVLSRRRISRKIFVPTESGRGDGVFGSALVGEFMLTFLLVFSVLQTAVYSDFDFSSLVCFANLFGRVPGPLPLILIDGCSINPTRPFFQLSCRGSLDARRSSFSTCEASGFWTIGRCCSCSRLFASCSVLEGLRPPRPFRFCMEFWSHS